MKTIRIHHTSGTGYKDLVSLIHGTPFQFVSCPCGGRVWECSDSYMTADGTFEMATYVCYRCSREIHTERPIKQR